MIPHPDFVWGPPPKRRPYGKDNPRPDPSGYTPEQRQAKRAARKTERQRRKAGRA